MREALLERGWVEHTEVRLLLNFSAVIRIFVERDENCRSDMRGFGKGRPAGIPKP
jgi:hypothetical protein